MKADEIIVVYRTNTDYNTHYAGYGYPEALFTVNCCLRQTVQSIDYRVQGMSYYIYESGCKACTINNVGCAYFIM